MAIACSMVCLKDSVECRQLQFVYSLAMEKTDKLSCEAWLLIHCSLTLSCKPYCNMIGRLYSAIMQSSMYNRRGSLQFIANLLASAMAKDKVWVGLACIKALAVALGKGIVVICKSALLLFTK